MKCTYLLLFLILSAKLSFGQRDTVYQYYGSNEKPCAERDAYYVRMAIKKPSLWLVKDYYSDERTLKMSGMFSDDSFKIGQDNFLYYYKNGRLEKEGNYADGKKHGLWMGWDENGNTTDSSLYNDGMPYLFSYRWTDKRIILKGIYDSLGNGSGVETRYSENENGKVLSTDTFSAGYKKEGLRNYYYKSGRKCCKEIFVKDSLVFIECYREDGRIETDNCQEQVMPEASFDLTQFLGQNIIFPPSVRDNVPLGFSARVIVQFVVSENGNLENIEIFKHTLPALDNESIRVVKLMPKWIPGKRYNRPVRVQFRLPILFKTE
jgi:antitoxin component YwqK of YwqJK toxin-antitoxin module